MKRGILLGILAIIGIIGIIASTSEIRKVEGSDREDATRYVLERIEDAPVWQFFTTSNCASMCNYYGDRICVSASQYNTTNPVWISIGCNENQYPSRSIRCACAEP